MPFFRELRLSTNIMQAASRYRPDCWETIPLSVIRRRAETDRYFLSMAGAGPDGALMYRMVQANRSRWGKWLYYAGAFRLFLRNDFPPFLARYTTGLGLPPQERTCVSVMALRIGQLGGLFGGIARGASLRKSTMRLLLVHPPSVFSLPLWFACSWIGMSAHNPLLTIVDGNSLQVEPLTGAPQMQADGEWLGTAPADVALLQETIRLLVPIPRSPP